MIATAPAPTFLREPVVDEAAARAELRRQIARLDAEAGLLDPPVRLPGGPARGPRLLGVEELERERDRLAVALREAQRERERVGALHEANRALREEALLDPAAHPYVRISNADVGEPGCHDWHVRPRFGLLGAMMRWWRVVVSSGCP